MWKQVSLWAFVAAGLSLVIWGITILIHPTTSCRGVEMGPGDVCAKALLDSETSQELQTYEQRIATVRQQVPFMIGAGAAVTIFGVVVALRSGKQGHRPVDEPSLLPETHLDDPDIDEILEGR